MCTESRACLGSSGATELVDDSSHRSTCLNAAVSSCPEGVPQKRDTVEEELVLERECQPTSEWDESRSLESPIASCKGDSQTIGIVTGVGPPAQTEMLPSLATDPASAEKDSDRDIGNRGCAFAAKWIGGPRKAWRARPKRWKPHLKVRRTASERRCARRVRAALLTQKPSDSECEQQACSESQARTHDIRASHRPGLRLGARCALAC